MTSSNDVSSASSTQPSSTPAPSSTPSSNPWSASDFQTTLTRLASERRDYDVDPRQAQVSTRAQPGRPNVGQEEDDDESDGRDSGGGAPDRMLARDGQGELAADSKQEGRLEGLFNHGLAHLPAGLAFEAPASAGSADIEAFAAAMEKALVASEGQGGKQVSLRFVDPFSPLASIGVSRLANGTLALQLSAQAHSQATPELSRTLDALKKRMEARGLQVAEVTFSEDDGELERLIPKVR